jgi:DNA invertase Pin-like site-specific DNA recombinase
MFIGYVSTADQTLDLQKDALEKAGCTKIFTDTASGAKAERTGLDEALHYVRSGDTLVVWRLDRLGRSLRHLIETITGLANREIGFKSITESIDTTTSGGKLVLERSPSSNATSFARKHKLSKKQPPAAAAGADLAGTVPEEVARGYPSCWRPAIGKAIGF